MMTPRQASVGTAFGALVTKYFEWNSEIMCSKAIPKKLFVYGNDTYSLKKPPTQKIFSPFLLYLYRLKKFYRLS